MVPTVYEIYITQKKKNLEMHKATNLLIGVLQNEIIAASCIE